jgi:hypothetical protein
VHAIMISMAVQAHRLPQPLISSFHQGYDKHNARYYYKVSINVLTMACTCHYFSSICTGPDDSQDGHKHAPLTHHRCIIALFEQPAY